MRMKEVEQLSTEERNRVLELYDQGTTPALIWAETGIHWTRFAQILPRPRPCLSAGRTCRFAQKTPDA